MPQTKSCESSGLWSLVHLATTSFEPLPPVESGTVRHIRFPNDGTMTRPTSIYQTSLLSPEMVHTREEVRVIRVRQVGAGLELDFELLVAMTERDLVLLVQAK